MAPHIQTFISFSRVEAACLTAFAGKISDENHSAADLTVIAADWATAEMDSRTTDR
jgi:hypothetical protein